MKIDVEIKNATMEEAKNIKCLDINYIRFYDPKEQGIDAEVCIEPISASVSKVNGHPFSRKYSVEEWGIIHKDGEIEEMYEENDEYLMDIANKYKRVELVLEDDVSYNPDIEIVVDTLWFSWPVTEWENHRKRYSW